ncbi:TRAP transporter small permease [Desulfotomaculum sp. 1211_IL3151]|uniref:TRAP transporter small permease n=1 Tax=Desulfotomaculum sp. 1211_IL3151 TaxID=3084055 RepID=UPI002FD8B31C
MKERLKWVIDNLEEILCAFFLVATVILMSSQVFYRYFFGKSIASAEELARIAFLVMVYLATAHAAKHGRHVRVTAQFRLFPSAWRKYFIMFADMIWLFFNGVVIWQGILLYQSMNQFPLKSAVLDLNLKYAFAVIPIAFLLQSIRILERYYKLYRAGRLEQLATDGEEF